ncbi:MAG TPA: hypothetical protein VFF65_04830, partial [Phycisphaerales bacterium]|nr:hypothetical protein [Phycisphaerales bacterium]
MESQTVPMSYREKSALVTLLVSLVVYGIYFGGTVYVGPDPQLWASLGLFICTVFALALGMIMVHVVIALTTPRELKDERDVAVELRS